MNPEVGAIITRRNNVQNGSIDTQRSYAFFRRKITGRELSNIFNHAFIVHLQH